MNKSEKIIVALLGLLLVAYFWHSSSQAKKEAEEQAKVWSSVSPGKPTMMLVRRVRPRSLAPRTQRRISSRVPRRCMRRSRWSSS